LAKQYGVRGIPDVRILDAGGKELARIRGFKGEEATVKVLQGLF
jgi:thioredoxin-related protein